VKHYLFSRSKIVQLQTFRWHILLAKFYTKQNLEILINFKPVVRKVTSLFFDGRFVGQGHDQSELFIDANNLVADSQISVDLRSVSCGIDDFLIARVQGHITSSRCLLFSVNAFLGSFRIQARRC
jgi:hypothetical protein